MRKHALAAVNVKTTTVMQFLNSEKKNKTSMKEKIGRLIKLCDKLKLSAKTYHILSYCNVHGFRKEFCLLLNYF